MHQPGFEVVVSVVDDSGESAEPRRVTLRPDEATPGFYEGYFSPPRPGRYRLEASSADLELANTTEFQVADINPEMANTDAQIEPLRRIADLSGGECLSALRIQELASLLDREAHTTTIRTDRPLWDNWWIAMALVALLGFEWLVRRRYDLP